MLSLQMRVAKDRHCFIEVLVLQTALIDALLRMGLVLREQIDQGHADVEFNYLYQVDDERNFNERQVYRLALKQGVLNEVQFHKLESLYKLRNRAIHRMIISEIRYTELVPVTLELDEAIAVCTAIVSQLEDYQIEHGVGMTTEGSGKPFTVGEAKEMILKKI